MIGHGKSKKSKTQGEGGIHISHSKDFKRFFWAGLHKHTGWSAIYYAIFKRHELTLI